MHLEAHFEKIKYYFPHLDARNEKVSKVDVAWQLDHSLQVLIEVSKAILASDPQAYQAQFNLRFELLSLLNWFPRGKGKAPKAVVPQEKSTAEGLSTKLAEAKQLLKQLEDLSDKHYFDHPLFGQIKKQRALRFLEMHTEHHLKIVREIITGQ